MPCLEVVPVIGEREVMLVSTMSSRGEMMVIRQAIQRRLAGLLESLLAILNEILKIQNLKTKLPVEQVIAEITGSVTCCVQPTT